MIEIRDLHCTLGGREVLRGVESVAGLKAHLEKRLHGDLGVKVAVELVEEGALAEVTNLGREGKAKRLRHLPG